VADAARDAGLRVSMVPTLSELLQPLPTVLSFPAPRPATDDQWADRELRRDTETRPVAVLPARPVESRAKRLLDLTLCLTSILVLLPLLLLIAVALKISTGEVIYRAERIGRDAKPFTMYKFSTMVPGDGGLRVTREGDPRITPMGRWLRASKLNELPQIFNVIKGDMSLVGPRPEDPRYTAQYSARQRLVLAVRPGMTSLAFLRFGDEQAFIERACPPDIETFYLQELLPEKLDIELDYIKNWSMRQDWRILVQTIRELLR
jgi:lipopolysaccharide/colanic/teichoic acid biosynthesis glycosyltransferase